MTFNINALEHYEDDGWDDLEDYAEQLVDLFIDSPEGQAHAEQYGAMGGWASHLIEMGFIYQEVALSKMNAEDVEAILLNIFPRKITLRSPDDVDEILAEIIAFWAFLQREYQLFFAPKILQYLKTLDPDIIKAEMYNPDKFGMAKSFLQAGLESGFDMTTNEGLQAFQQQYNAQLLGGRDLPLSLPPLAAPEEEEPKRITGKKPKTKQRKRQAMAKASRKRNRKKRK